VQDNRTLNRLAMSDGLTGLSNRRHFDTELERSWKHAKRDDEWLSVVFIDLDGFKQYNDFYGHVEGDDCLRRVAATLKKRARRARDVTCRYGGDEFVTLLYGTDPVGAQAVAAAMQAEIWAMDLRHAFSHFGRVTVSVGVASVRPAMDGSTAVDLLRRADEALYRDKRVKRRPRLSQVDNSGVMDG
jgi:diguanylate cyclase (GGDEF)-like protein